MVYPTLTNFQKVINAIKEYGIDVSELEKIVFDPKKTFLPTIPGDISFKTAKENSETLKIKDTEVFIIGYDDLIKNKISTNVSSVIHPLQEFFYYVTISYSVKIISSAS